MPPPALLDLPRFQLPLLWSTLLDLLSRLLLDWEKAFYLFSLKM